VAAGATTDSVPPDLSPSLKDASKDLLRPPGGDCSPLPIERLKSTEDPCTFATGAPTESPKIVLIGDSQAWMWSVPVFTVAKELGYGFGLAYQASCHMPAVEFPSAEGGVTDAQCRAWRKAAIDWVNHQNPAVVLVVSGGHLVKNISDAEYAAGYAETLKQMQGPGRKLFVIGAVPLINQDPPRCLAAHSSSALSCATPTSVAVKENLHSDLDAAQQTGAGYVNLLPWLCTADVCPSIIGKYLAYQNQAHMTTTYAEHLIPVLKLALGLSPV
jgi:hypothetical protein